MNVWGLSDFQRYKLLSKPVSDAFRDSGLSIRGDEIRHCGDYLHFVEDPETQKRILVSANFCKDRFCPMCNARRSYKVSAKLFSVLMSRPDINQKRFLMVTLTARNVPISELGKRIDVYQTAIKDMFHQRRYCDGRFFSGYVRSLEFTINSKKYDAKGGRNKDYMTFHPHFHILLECASGFDKSDIEIREMFFNDWKYYLHKYDETVKVDAKGFEAHFVHAEEDGSSGLISACCEVTKYSLKSSECCAVLNKNGHSEWVIPFSDALKGRRLFVSSRSMRLVDEALDEDLLHCDLNDDPLACKLNSHLVQLHVYRYIWEPAKSTYIEYDSSAVFECSDSQYIRVHKIICRCRDGDNKYTTKIIS